MVHDRFQTREDLRKLCRGSGIGRAVFHPDSDFDLYKAISLVESLGFPHASLFWIGGDNYNVNAIGRNRNGTNRLVWLRKDGSVG